MPRRRTPCAVCGRICVGEVCMVCFRLGRRAAPLFCVCAEPRPRPVAVFGAVIAGSECERCSRPIL